MEAPSGTPTPVATLTAYSRLCCRRCVQPVKITGDPQWGRAVHTVTSKETGPDGHLVAPIDADLARAAVARKAGEGS
jgi:hypothetical protein